jgi:ADP-ribose pyrophosphatase YjhB (NUDIX family)
MIQYTFCPRCATPLETRERYGKPRPVCPACGFVHFANPRVAVALLLAEPDRVLLVKRGMPPEKGAWALPAGFVDAGERPEQAAAREMHEETGLEVAVTRLLEVSFEETSQAIVLLYRVRLLGGELHADDDVEDARWFGRKELPELAFESTRRSISAWLAGKL